MQTQAVQRLRLTFRKFGPTRFIGHLDLARAWERALNRARIPMCYSQGFNRRPRMQFAAPLPLGYTSDCELVDLWLQEMLEPATVQARLMVALPPGVELVAVAEVALRQPSLPSLVMESVYEMTLLDESASYADLAGRVDAFLAASEVVRVRDDKTYDLRPLVLALALEESVRPTQSGPVLVATLRQTQNQVGRPDELLRALGLEPLDARVHRRALTLSPDAFSLA